MYRYRVDLSDGKKIDGFVKLLNSMPIKATLSTHDDKYRVSANSVASVIATMDWNGDVWCNSDIDIGHNIRFYLAK